jgi:fermentation-respiration switch protein FrsA (DUF1100 family)
MERLRAALLGVLTVLTASACFAAPSQAADPTPYGLACKLEPYGVRFCPLTAESQRVPSWDGTPLDVDVTLPATGDAPFPTITMLHGYGGTKAQQETVDADGGNHYTNVWFAKQGYAVVNFTARGAGESCGTVTARFNTPACDRGWFHLGDQRYDARDAQSLLGTLVDQGIADPKALGAMGLSLGSLTSLSLAVLHDRIRLPDGTFVPWTSPKGVPLKFAGVFTTLSISSLQDLVAANGRFMDGEVPSPQQDREPIGVAKTSFPAFALGAGPALNYIAPPGADPTADFVNWLATEITASPDDPRLAQVAAEFGGYHQSAGLPIDGTIAPLLIGTGWADDIVNGPTQALRLYNSVRAQVPDAPVSIVVSSVGHARSASPIADAHRVYGLATKFMAHHLLGRPGGPKPGSVTASTISCPAGTPSEGPFVARDWGSLASGAVRFAAPGGQTVTSTGGDPVIAAQYEPVANSLGPGGGDPCVPVQSADAPGTAVASAPVTKSFTLLGRPTLTMDIVNHDSWAQLNGRLWDVDPDGQQILVARAVYAVTPGQTGAIAWQLNGAGYRFASGHVIRLELAGEDAPFIRPSLKPFSVDVENISVEVPTHEAPDGGQIVAPTVNHAAPVARSRCRTIRVRLRGLHKVRVRANGHRVRVRSGVARVKARRGRRTTIRITAKSRAGKTIHRVRRVAAC